MSRSSINLVPRLAAAVSLAVLILGGGCASPVSGPTDPVVFMKERRQWTTTAAEAAAQANQNSPAAPDAAALPVDPVTPAPAPLP